MMNFALGVIAGSLRKIGAAVGSGPFTLDANTVMLIHFDVLPFTDVAGYAITVGSAITSEANAAALSEYQANFTSGTGSVIATSGYTILNPNASFTIEFFLTTSGTSANILYMYDNNSGNRIYLYLYQNKLLFSTSGYTDLQSTTVANDGVRRHVRVVYDSTGKISYLFINGVIEKQQAQTGSFSGSYPANMFIGGSGASSGTFTGKLDEFRISNGARSTANFTPA